MSIKKGDKFHFIAAGGVGQSALAKILLQRGYEVFGSDISDSKYLKELKALGGRVFIGHDEKNLSDNSIVVISSAIKEDNPELQKARRLNLKVLHRSDMLLKICNDFPLTVGFSGTHGKTTTSGLMAYVLSKMNQKPAFAVGGIIPELNTNANASADSKIFIAELDESDGTIIKYTPKILVVNNLEADHPDFYKNGFSDVLKIFKELIYKQSPDSKIILNIDDNGVLELLKAVGGRDNIVKFSAKSNNGAEIFAKNIEFTDFGTKFSVLYKGKNLGEILTSLKGVHNVYNTLAVISALIEAGFDFKDFAPYFKGFAGMGRRFQTVYKDEIIEIIDDYAHHPSEIKATLLAAKEYKLKSSKNRIVAIFQPHRYSRLKALWEDFMESFDNADVLIVVDAYSAGDKFDDEFNSDNFALKIAKNKDKEVFYAPGKIDETLEKILPLIKNGDIVLTLGAGDVTKLGPLIGESLKNKKVDKDERN